MQFRGWLCYSVVSTFDQHGTTRNFSRDPLVMLDMAYFPKALSSKGCASVRIHMFREC